MLKTLEKTKGVRKEEEGLDLDEHLKDWFLKLRSQKVPISG